MKPMACPLLIMQLMSWSEVKLGDSFPSRKVHIETYSMPYRLDRNTNGGGVLIYIKDSNFIKILSKDVLSVNMETLFIDCMFLSCLHVTHIFVKELLARNSRDI